MAARVKLTEAQRAMLQYLRDVEGDYDYAEELDDVDALIGLFEADYITADRARIGDFISITESGRQAISPEEKDNAD